MRTIAENWTEDCVAGDSQGSVLQVWAEVDGNWRVNFALGTIQALDEPVSNVQDDCIMEIDHLHLSELITLVPE